MDEKWWWILRLPESVVVMINGFWGIMVGFPAVIVLMLLKGKKMIYSFIPLHYSILRGTFHFSWAKDTVDSIKEVNGNFSDSVCPAVHVARGG